MQSRLKIDIAWLIYIKKIIFRFAASTLWVESEGTSNTSIQLEQSALFPLFLKFSLTTDDNDEVFGFFCVVKSLAS